MQSNERNRMKTIVLSFLLVGCNAKPAVERVQEQVDRSVTKVWAPCGEDERALWAYEKGENTTNLVCCPKDDGLDCHKQRPGPEL